MTAQSAQRFCIRLDPAMLLEGLLLERLERVPKARRQEWLRGLLVQGYLWEGRTSRGVQRTEAQSFAGDQTENKEPALATAFGGWLTRPQPPMSRVAPECSASLQARRITPEKQEIKKPFAHLRKVIG